MLADRVQDFVSELIDMTQKGFLLWEHFPSQCPSQNDLFIQYFIQKHPEMDQNRSYFFSHKNGLVLFVRYTSGHVTESIYIQKHFGEPIINLIPDHEIGCSTLQILGKAIDLFIQADETSTDSLYQFLYDIERTKDSSNISDLSTKETPDKSFDISEKGNTTRLDSLSKIPNDMECLNDSLGTFDISTKENQNNSLVIFKKTNESLDILSKVLNDMECLNASLDKFNTSTKENSDKSLDISEKGNAIRLDNLSKILNDIKRINDSFVTFYTPTEENRNDLFLVFKKTNEISFHQFPNDTINICKVSSVSPQSIARIIAQIVALQTTSSALFFTKAQTTIEDLLKKELAAYEEQKKKLLKQ